MNNKLKLAAEQLLLVMNLFVLFLLLFTNYLVLPYWLQPLGRMHPLLLHFPITLLLFSVVLNWYANIGTTTRKENLKPISNALLLVGALLAGTTVIAGLFLSREEGYSGDALLWHKWTGASLFFLASSTYIFEYSKIKFKYISRILGILTVLAVILTGHFGGILSHGEQFILQPILSNIQKPEVPFDSALVYKDVIQPILEKKCSSCHNLQKMKGELSLADSIGIMKGGKSGHFFEPGNPNTSLLIQRIHLNAEDEKHMPPISRAQLNNDEINLLGWWVKNHTNFNQKLSALAENDSLRIWATKLHFNNTSVEQNFLFPAADPAIISKLNTSYRSVLKEDRGSPALEVRIFNKESYGVQQLEEMEEIKQQVTSLSLSKLPVSDDDLKKIGLFENLNKLDLNFTNITSAGLSSLTSLKYLEKLSLTGTHLAAEELKKVLGNFKNMKTITLWNTNLSTAEIDQLQDAFKKINIINGYSMEASEQLKLNPPQVKNSSLVFNQSIVVDLRHPIKGSEIRYTLNGLEPDSLNSPVFNNKTILTQTTTLKAKAFKKGWYSSDGATFGFYKNSYIPDSVTILSPLNHVHQAEGAQTFFNSILGTLGANNPAWANFWAGVRNNDLLVECFFNKPINLSSFGMHYMVEESTGIYPPASFEVWGGTDPKKLTLLSKIIPALPVKEETPSLKLAEGKFTPRPITYLKIIARPHVKKKDHHLLLVDEFFLN